MGVVSSFWIKSFKVLLHLRRLLFVCLFVCFLFCAFVLVLVQRREQIEATTGCFQSLFARVAFLPKDRNPEDPKHYCSHSYSIESFNDKECVTTSHPVMFQSFGPNGRKIRSF